MDMERERRSSKLRWFVLAQVARSGRLGGNRGRVVSVAARVLCAFVVVASSGVAASAPNVAPLSADARSTQAREDCLAGRYQSGIDILARLFTETEDPTHIYNQGRCFQQNGRYADAISRFREYMRKARDATPAERAEVEAHIAECEKRLPEGQGTAPAPPPSAPGPFVATLTETSAGPGDERRRQLRMAAVVAGGVAVVALGFGATMGFKTRAVERSTRTSRTCPTGSRSSRPPSPTGSRRSKRTSGHSAPESTQSPPAPCTFTSSWKTSPARCPRP